MVRPKARIEKQQLWRESFDTTVIMRRLNNQALADKEIMPPAAIAAAKILLAKTLPDLKAVEHSGDVSVKAINIQF